MEENVGITNADLFEHIGHTWDMEVACDRVYLLCDCGDVITSCSIIYPHTPDSLRNRMERQKEE